MRDFLEQQLDSNTTTTNNKDFISSLPHVRRIPIVYNLAAQKRC